MTVNRAWNSRFMGWIAEATRRPATRRRCVLSNFFATFERAPIVVKSIRKNDFRNYKEIFGGWL